MTIFITPVQLGREALERDVLAEDRKSCKRFGPCGVGEKALYLGGFALGCRYYLPYSGSTRVFKHEEQVDQLLSYLKWTHPEIRQVSAPAEARLAEKEREQLPKPELTEEARWTLETLKAAEAVLEKRPDLYLELSKSAREKRQLLLKAAQRRGGTVKAKEQPILDRAEQAQKEMEQFLSGCEGFPLPARYAHPVVLHRMARTVEAGWAVTSEQALEAVKAGLKVLNASVQVSQEEHDEVVAVKAMFLNENYR